MGQELKYMLEETPLGWTILAVSGLAVLLAGLGLVLGLLRGRRLRRVRAEPPASQTVGRFSWAPELLTVAAALALPLLVLISVQLARGQMMQAVAAADPAQKAMLLAMGVSGQLNALGLGSQVALLLLPLAGAALGLLLARRVQLGGLRRAARLAGSQGPDAAAVKAWRAHPGPGVGHLLPLTLGAGVLGAGLCFGVLAWCSGLIRAFAGVAGVDPEHKAALLLAGMDEVRPPFERIPLVMGAAAVVLAGVAVVLLHLFAPARSRHRLAPELPAAPRLSWTATLVSGGAGLALAALFALLALPYRAENHSPLPVKRDGGHVLMTVAGVNPPALQGPDRLERAPVLAVSRQQVSIDGRPLTGPQHMAEQLQVMRDNFKLVHPDRPFPAELVLVADRRVPARRVAPWLRAARGAGYHRLALGFVRSAALQRPVLGRVVRTTESAARLELVDRPPADARPYRFAGDPPAGNGPLVLDPPPELPYERLARTVVQAREAGREVSLVLAPAD